ncbi:MAG: GerMN domain-containing protein [Clostridia bacterium]|nr:GerMN domain-containing protein [Clostridia bacterium]MBQ6859547.1 GerMN domain-containing protein [Clostridia bacterium]
MKKAMVCVLLTLAIVLGCEPHLRQAAKSRAAGVWRSLTEEKAESAYPAQEPQIAEQLGSHSRTDLIPVTLYYRYGDTSVLGAQQAQLDIRREETVASSIVQRLVDGPSISHERLSGVFPQGTRVISVRGDGTTAFVTLSRGFLGRPDGAPADWEDLPQWQEEAALRRLLAAQSIVLSLTEDARYQRVQLFIADGDDDIPERIPLAYFDPQVADPALVLAASARDERMLLTPRDALEAVLSAWQARDWAAAYAYLGDEQGALLPALSVFEAEMNELDITLLDFDVSEGTVSFDGQRATLVLNAEIRSIEGGDAQIVRESVPLARIEDNWAIAPDTLRSLMIRD